MNETLSAADVGLYTWSVSAIPGNADSASEVGFSVEYPNTAWVPGRLSSTSLSRVSGYVPEKFIAATASRPASAHAGGCVRSSLASDPIFAAIHTSSTSPYLAAMAAVVAIKPGSFQTSEQVG
jgi:hypothetical protein